jgi:hypothetical protein
LNSRLRIYVFDIIMEKLCDLLQGTKHVQRTARPKTEMSQPLVTRDDTTGSQSIATNHFAQSRAVQDGQFCFQVWFAEGPTFYKYFWRHSWRQRIRLLRRQTALVSYLVGSELIKFIIGSRLSHVLIEYDGIVLDSQFTGVRYWAADNFRKVYPGRRVYINMLANTEPDLSRYEPPAPWGPIKAVLYGTITRFLVYITRGKVRLADDCVAIANSALREAGHPVPHSITTPVQLLARLKEEGHAVIATTSAGHGGTTSKRVG